MRNQQPILVVEDDQVDVMTIYRAFKELNITNPVLVAGSGEEALAMLRDHSSAWPGLILLDLNMPRMNGLEFLRAVKADVELRRIPVVALTTSRTEHDRLECFSLGVAGYMTKPVDYRQFVEVARVITQYWMLSELPD